jgi:NAD(P)-dependent dehydrogenase (short-subunit alcohol dehydrogenase family)
VQVLGGVGVELECSRKGVEHLLRGVMVATLLEPDVVVGAHPRQHRDLLTPQTRNAAAPEFLEPGVGGMNQLTAGAQVLADPVFALRHAFHDAPARTAQGGPDTPRLLGTLANASGRHHSGAMTNTATTSLITTPFGFGSTASEVLSGVDLSGKRAIVTGASSGIGIKTALALLAAGAEVTLAVRDTDAGARTARDIGTKTGSRAMDVRRLDLADQRSVGTFAANWSGPLHMLVNNAGVMGLPDRHLTADGWEMQFATNHLGHFALTNVLHDALAAAGGARVVSLSSEAHLRAPIVFDDLNFDSRSYDPWIAYGQSKTANVLFAVEAARRWAEDGIAVNAVHPGAVMETNLARHLDPGVLAGVVETSGYEYKTLGQGAATSVLVAASPLLDGISGRYFADCNEAPVVGPSFTGPPRGFGVAPYALDPDNANRLWELSRRR